MPRRSHLLTTATILIVATFAATPALAADPSPGPTGGPSTSADRIVFTREIGQDCATIHTIAPDGSDLRDIPSDCVGQAHARWEPGHTSIILDRDVSDAQRAIFRVDLATGEATQLSLSGPWDWEPAVSPDGRTIAFLRASDVRGLGIMLMDADGSNERRITTVPAAPDPRDEVPEYSPWDGAPAFSPDGREIVFIRVLDYNPARFQAALFIVGVDGEGLRQISDWLTSEPGRPTWSPDGSTILFGRDASL
jgi:TolB protein